MAVSDEDRDLLRAAIAFGRRAVKNHVKDIANRFHEVPLFVEKFPGGPKMCAAWSLDGKEDDPVCTDWRMLRALQRTISPVYDAPDSLNFMLKARFPEAGEAERLKWETEMIPRPHVCPGNHQNVVASNQTLAGNTKLGEDRAVRKLRSESLNKAKTEDMPSPGKDMEVCEALAQTQIISTASAKMSYLVDAIVRHQDDEQILVFYENENVAWYLGSILEIVRTPLMPKSRSYETYPLQLQVKHLIYARGISAERRAQYVETFNQNPKIR